MENVLSYYLNIETFNSTDWFDVMAIVQG